MQRTLLVVVGIVVGVVILLAPSGANASVADHCGTGARWRDAIARPRYALDQQPGGGDGKILTSPFGEQAYVTTSEHFALRAGDCRGWDERGHRQRCDAPDPLAVTRALAALETSYAYQVTTSGYVPPDPTYFINVYVDGTGQGIPLTGQDALAFTDIDDLGNPFIVVAHDVFYGYTATEPELAELPELADVTLAHELFHCMQFAVDRLNDYESFWYWEATATWMESEIFPDNKSGGGYTPAFVLQPQLSVGYFAFFDGADIYQSLHPYGASIFVTYLSEAIGGPSLIRATWQTPTRSESIFDVLTRLLPTVGAGKSLPDVFTDFAAHNVTLDYARGAEYRADRQDWIDSGYGGIPPFALTTQYAHVPSSGEAPQYLGYNIYTLPEGSADQEIVFTGSAFGSDHHDSRFGLRLVRIAASGTPTYVPLTLPDGRYGRFSIPAAAAGESLAITVAAVPDKTSYEESFSYIIQLVDHGGCSTTGGRTGGDGRGDLVLVLLALGAVVLTRGASSPRAPRSGTMRRP